MNLPERFLNDVKELLGDEFDDFIKSYEQKKTTAIRVNTMKIIKSYEQKKTTAIRVNTMKMEKDRLKGFLDCNTEDIPWAEEGLYYDEYEYKPGRNPLHDAGAYYLQEPSALSVVPKADIQEGDRVLDMCAAPGGKSTYILSKLNNTGLLVSNEINATRINVPKADIQEGDRVLDMCAAPGGKSTYILSKLNNTGLLVSNEINATRIKVQ